MKKIFTLKKIIIFILLIAIGFSVYYYFNNKKSKQTSSKVIEYKVQKKDIAVTLTGSGSVAQSYRQAITPYISGTVKKVYFKQGNKVKAGELMIEFDDTTIAKQIERTKLSIEQARRDLNDAKKNIADLTVTTPISGQIVGLTGNVGDDVNKGSVVCSVVDTSKLKFTVAFNKTQAKSFYVGEKAEVYLQDYMQTVEGKVSYINREGKMVDGGGLACDAEIIINNPGTIKSGIKASAAIDGQMSIDNSTLEYFDTRKVKCEPGGTIKNIAVHENQQVAEGQTIIKVDNPDLNDMLLSSEMKLQDLQAQLDSQLDDQKDYKITAPGNGTIVLQDIKPGDVVKQQDAISTIADNDSMQFDIAIDELDIDKISVGMNASVTFDALKNANYTGIVTQVATEGTASNGVSTYPVTIQIQNPTKIKAGMNANAEIVLQQKNDILTLPMSAVQKMGNMALVYVRKTVGAQNDSTAGNTQSGNPNGNNYTGGQNGTSGGRNNSTGGSNNSTSGSRNNGSGGGNSNNNSRMQAMLKTFGSDVTMKRIEVGINNDNDIEITSGLNEGDTVLVAVTTTSSTSSTTTQGASMFGGMGGAGGFQRNVSGGDSNARRTTTGGGSRGGN